MSKFLLIAIGIIVLIAVLTTLTRIIMVCGGSMERTYFDGDLLLALRIFRHRGLKVGDVVVCKSIMDEDKYVIKRISDIICDLNGTPTALFITGDNEECSFDSRHYGEVPIKTAKFKVWRKVK